MSIPLPGKGFCENLNKKLYKFVWDDKPDKIKRGILSQSKVNGGLKMPNIANVIYSLKCPWIRRIIVSPTRPWVILFESFFFFFLQTTQRYMTEVLEQIHINRDLQ